MHTYSIWFPPINLICHFNYLTNHENQDGKGGFPLPNRSILCKLQSDLLKLLPGSCYLFPKTFQGFPIISKTASQILWDLTSAFLYELFDLHCPVDALPMLLTLIFCHFLKHQVLTSGPLSIFLLPFPCLTSSHP